MLPQAQSNLTPSINTTYYLWDYELENGLDWDDVYRKYYPKFVELDKKDSVTDKELTDLMNEIVAPLHDGHLNIKIWNHSTEKYVTVSPIYLRIVREREEEFKATQGFLPSLKYSQDKGKVLEDTCEYCGGVYVHGIHLRCPHCGAAVKPAET